MWEKERDGTTSSRQVACTHACREGGERERKRALSIVKYIGLYNKIRFYLRKLGSGERERGNGVAEIDRAHRDMRARLKAVSTRTEQADCTGRLGPSPGAACAV